MNKYNEKIQDVIKRYETDINKGLSEKLYIEKVEVYGENKLLEKKGKTLLQMIILELMGFLNLLLIVAAIISIVASGHLTDGLFIIAIVILNTFLSVIQEIKASNEVEALKNMSAPNAKVIRDDEVKTVSSKEIVPGDIVLIEAGDYIPADIRIIDSTNLKVDESALTGESVPVEKDARQVLPDNTAIGDRINMGYMTTIVTYGRGKGLVTETGMDTEIGNIATMLNEVEDALTPLQTKINKLGKLLGILSVVVSVLIFVIGILYGEMEIVDIFLTSVSLAVAAIPEGLPTVITVVLAIGMRKMANKQAIVKKLSAVETLGSTTVICSDKTGTLTQNKMVVKMVFDGDKIFKVTGSGYEVNGEIEGESVNLTKLLQIAVLCNDSRITSESLIGDPTELSLITLGGKGNVIQQKINNKYPRLDEFPFDSDRKLMTTQHNIENNIVNYTKGAPDVILDRCSYYLQGGKIVKLDSKLRDVVELANKNMARKALRVLGFAYKVVAENSDIKYEENDLVFVGLVGIIDPPREEVKDSINLCHHAGIRVVMITGDHKITASAIGKELGIINDDRNSLSGEEIDKLTHEEFIEKIKYTNVFARVSPNHKVEIVKRLQEIGEITSMTGDGVNDAPALKQANIGVAMGITGTDVSKEAADMILMDDNFVTIVDAVEEGRVIYANIRKFVGFLISCNVGEVLLIFIAMLLGWGSPLLPIQILWINLVTDSFPAFALGLEKKEENIMNNPPIDPKSSIVDNKMKIAVLFQSLFLAFSVLLSYYIGKQIHINMDDRLLYGSTFAFITIITGELLRAYSARSENITIFKMNIFGNKFINFSVLLGLILLIIVVYVPGINTVFHTIPLTLLQFSIAFALGFVPLFGGEIAKIFK